MTCRVLMRRVPLSVEGRREEHGYVQECGRPVEADGLCAFHLRKRDADPDVERTLRQLIRGRR